MIEGIRRHLGEIWAISAIAVILSSVAAGMLLFSDQVVGCTGPVRLASLEPVETLGGIEVPADAEMVAAAWAHPIDASVWIVMRAPADQVRDLVEQEPFENVVENLDELDDRDWLRPHWHERPEWVPPLPDQRSNIIFAQHVWREWTTGAAFVAVLAPQNANDDGTLTAYVGVQLLRSD